MESQLHDKKEYVRRHGCVSQNQDQNDTTPLPTLSEHGHMTPPPFKP